MATVLVSLGVAVALMIAAFVFVGWRDRRRLSSPEDSAAAREAAAAQERYAAERYGDQGELWRRGKSPPTT
ncbi:hypothetical protein [Micromonospora inositola]|uniref:hypothetical protein n=1 Tax=Micromonospora inositola TaxID=47865 RepID=UPI0012FD41B7|nr:hypothetical protein [Micromonospora inositola]